MSKYNSKSKRLCEVFFRNGKLYRKDCELCFDNGEWFFRVLRRENREIIASSEGYKRKIDCIKTAKLVTGGRLKITVIK